MAVPDPPADPPRSCAAPTLGFPRARKSSTRLAGGLLQAPLQTLSLPFGRSLNVRYGSLADISERTRGVRFTPEGDMLSVSIDVH